MLKFSINKGILFKIAGGILVVLLAAYTFYLLMVLLNGVSEISGNNLLKAPDIANFNLEKFEELKLSR